MNLENQIQSARAQGRIATPLAPPRSRGRSLRRFISALCLASITTSLATAATNSVIDVKTLGGGPTPADLRKSGFRNGNTLLEAKFNQPSGIAVLPDGTLVVADRNNKKLRAVVLPDEEDLSFTVTFASGLAQPAAVAVDRAGNVYAANARNGTVTVYDGAGVLQQTYSGFRNPTAIAVDTQTNIYVAEAGGAIRSIAADGTSGTVAEGFVRPAGLAVLDAATLAVSDSRSHGIYKVDVLTGNVTLFTGGNGAGFADGSATAAKFNTPSGIAVAPNGTIVVADRLNHRVRLVATNGAVSTLYGASKTSWLRPFAGWRDGDPTTAQAREPSSVAVSTNGTVYVTEAYWQILRSVTGANLTGSITNDNSGGGGGGGGTSVAAPTFTPMSGFYPMGITVTVTSSVPVYYTTDGTEPTTNSRQVVLTNNVGTIFFAETTRDLTSLRLKAFNGGVGSTTVSGVPSSLNEVGVPRDLVAGIGSTIVVPIVVNLRASNEIRSLQYRVEISPQNGAPPILPQFRATSMSSNDFIPVVTAAAPNTEAVYNAVPYPVGSTRGLAISAIATNANFDIKNFAVAAMLVIPVDSTASEGQTYRIQVLEVSATSDARGQLVPISPMPARTITIANVPYLVGDSSPALWYNAGDFGDGDLRNDDVNSVFYAHHGVRIPYQYTDVFNAMDAYPPDEPGFARGDGFIDFADFNVIFARSIRLDPNNWTRHWTDGGMLTADPATLGTAAPLAASRKAATAPAGPGTVWLRQVALGAGTLANVIPGEQYMVPIWARVAPGCSLAGLSMRLAVTPDGNAPAPGLVSFLPVIGNENFLGGNGVAPNEALCSWLVLPSPAFVPSLRGSNLLGYLRFTVPHFAAPGQTYSVHFLKMSGGADINTHYDFEGIPGKAWVQSNPPGAPEMTSDEWRKHFFGADPVSSDMLADPDGDGAPNWQEYLEGTNPTDAASRLHLEQATVSTDNGPVVQLSWLSASLKLYTVERGATANGPWTPLATNIAGDGYQKQLSDNAPSAAAPYYRVRVQP